MIHTQTNTWRPWRTRAYLVAIPLAAALVPTSFYVGIQALRIDDPLASAFLIISLALLLALGALAFTARRAQLRGWMVIVGLLGFVITAAALWFSGTTLTMNYYARQCDAEVSEACYRFARHFHGSDFHNPEFRSQLTRACDLGHLGACASLITTGDAESNSAPCKSLRRICAGEVKSRYSSRTACNVHNDMCQQ